MVGKFEKIAATLISWPFLGTLLGFLFGALFGAVGVIAGLARSVWLGVKYCPDNSTVTISSKRLLTNRLFIVFLYVLAIYTVIISVFFPEL